MEPIISKDYVGTAVTRHGITVAQDHLAGLAETAQSLHQAASVLEGRTTFQSDIFGFGTVLNHWKNLA